MPVTASQGGTPLIWHTAPASEPAPQVSQGDILPIEDIDPSCFEADAVSPFDGADLLQDDDLNLFQGDDFAAENAHIPGAWLSSDIRQFDDMGLFRDGGAASENIHISEAGPSGGILQFDDIYPLDDFALSTQPLPDAGPASDSTEVFRHFWADDLSGAAVSQSNWQNAPPDHESIAAMAAIAAAEDSKSLLSEIFVYRRSARAAPLWR